MRAALARRGDDAGLERVLELDARWRELTQELEGVQAELNEASRGRTGPPTRSPETSSQRRTCAAEM